jgi:hypothetical protein
MKQMYPAVETRKNLFSKIDQLKQLVDDIKKR